MSTKENNQCFLSLTFIFVHFFYNLANRIILNEFSFLVKVIIFFLHFFVFCSYLRKK